MTSNRRTLPRSWDDLSKVERRLPDARLAEPLNKQEQEERVTTRLDAGALRQDAGHLQLASPKVREREQPTMATREERDRSREVLTYEDRKPYINKATVAGIQTVFNRTRLSHQTWESRQLHGSSRWPTSMAQRCQRQHRHLPRAAAALTHEAGCSHSGGRIGLDDGRPDLPGAGHGRDLGRCVQAHPHGASPRLPALRPVRCDQHLPGL